MTYSHRRERTDGDVPKSVEDRASFPVDEAASETLAFFGTSKTAVENQIYIALIAYLLLYLTKRRLNTTKTLLTCKRLLQTLLWNLGGHDGRSSQVANEDVERQIKSKSVIVTLSLR